MECWVKLAKDKPKFVYVCAHACMCAHKAINLNIIWKQVKMKNIVLNNAGLEGINKCNELSHNWDISIDHSTIKTLETSRKRKWEKCKIQRAISFYTRHVAHSHKGCAPVMCTRSSQSKPHHPTPLRSCQNQAVTGGGRIIFGWWVCSCRFPLCSTPVNSLVSRTQWVFEDSEC